MTTDSVAPRSPHIVIVGAGSIGCYLGGRLLAAGASVTMIGRPRLHQVFETHPLRVSDYHGFDSAVQLAPYQFTTSPEPVAHADLVLLTVKSAATEDTGREIAPLLRPNIPVISFQNGIGNADRLRPLLPKASVLAGMVSFNVLQKTPGHFHQGTEGKLMAEASLALTPEIIAAFNNAGIPLTPRTDMHSVLWSKLLLNLNNPINALSGLPLKEQLSTRAYRRCLAMAQDETLSLLKAANIPTIKMAAVPMEWIPTVMRLPDWLFRRLAQTMLAVDPIARSSMWEDLEAGRKTEIEWINGEVIRLAKAHGRTAPVNQRLVDLIHQSESGQRQAWPGLALLHELTKPQA